MIDGQWHDESASLVWGLHSLDEIWICYGKPDILTDFIYRLTAACYRWRHDNNPYGISVWNGKFITPRCVSVTRMMWKPNQADVKEDTLQWRHNERNGVSNHWRLFSQPYAQVQIKEKYQSSVSLAFVRWIHRSPVDSSQKASITRKMFHLMTSPCSIYTWVDTGLHIFMIF